MKDIRISGARVHNLKGFDVSIPKNKLTVATGVSGSGKSSLVFDIVFEEGRKQYLQSLGILSDISKERKFDSISGIGPTIAVKQNIIRQSNPRSTVGSRTELLNMLAVLYSSEGKVDGGKSSMFDERLDPSYFSYNTPNGMCNTCMGRGRSYQIDMKRLVPTTSTTVEQVFAVTGVTPGYMNLARRHFTDFMHLPYMELTDEGKQDVMFGKYINSNFQKRSISLTRILQAKIDKYGRDDSGIYTLTECQDCKGTRVGDEARRVLLNGRHIGELASSSLVETAEIIQELLDSNSLSNFGQGLASKIARKLDTLIKSRLGHLSLFREMPSLSGGEIQRLFLNKHIDSEMDSLIYILDEPTVGLHESEKAELLKSIVELKDLGNTVIVVEHDKNTIELADHIIDIGPKAGVEGGQLLYQGDLQGLIACKYSLTGKYISGQSQIQRRKRSNIDDDIADNHEGRVTFKAKRPCVTLHNCQTNNLKNVTVSLPLGILVGIAGASGSGKSSLISNTLVPLLKQYFSGDSKKFSTELEDDTAPEENVIKPVVNKIDGLEHVDGIAVVSQSPIGRNMSSNPATYIKIWDKIRMLFASQNDAVSKNLGAGHFSFNSDGACSECSGTGIETIKIGRDLELHNVCKACNGKRYNDEALSVHYKGKNIHDVLEMRVSEAVNFFAGHNNITAPLKIMQRIGMGYIGLGQPTPTLSGGEAQRIKLAKEIDRKRKGNILYVLDEPTTGLSLYDTEKLIALLDELVEDGNSVLVIEHDTSVLESCDWVIELGPEGGPKGGYVLAEGSPESLTKNEKSITGKYLNL